MADSTKTLTLGTNSMDKNTFKPDGKCLAGTRAQGLLVCLQQRSSPHGSQRARSCNRRARRRMAQEKHFRQPVHLPEPQIAQYTYIRPLDMTTKYSATLDTGPLCRGQRHTSKPPPCSQKKETAPRAMNATLPRQITEKETQPNLLYDGMTGTLCRVTPSSSRFGWPTSISRCTMYTDRQTSTTDTTPRSDDKANYDHTTAYVCVSCPSATTQHAALIPTTMRSYGGSVCPSDNNPTCRPYYNSAVLLRKGNSDHTTAHVCVFSCLVWSTTTQHAALVPTNRSYGGCCCCLLAHQTKKRCGLIRSSCVHAPPPASRASTPGAFPLDLLRIERGGSRPRLSIYASLDA